MGTFERDPVNVGDGVGHSEDVESVEATGKHKEFLDLLKQAEEMAREVVQENNGIVDPESALLKRDIFLNEMVKISNVAQEAVEILPDVDGKNPLIANTGFGRVATFGEFGAKDWGHNDTPDSEIKREGDSLRDGASLKGRWFTDVQDFFNQAQKLTEYFNRADRASGGALTKALKGLEIEAE